MEPKTVLDDEEKIFLCAMFRILKGSLFTHVRNYKDKFLKDNKGVIVENVKLDKQYAIEYYKLVVQK